MSYERDIGEKLVGYALAGVQQYVVINVRARAAEIFTDPDSTNGNICNARDSLANQVLLMSVGESETRALLVSDLLR